MLSDSQKNVPDKLMLAKFLKMDFLQIFVLWILATHVGD